MDIQKTMQNLEKNGIKPYFVENKDEVVPLVKTLINNGESVSCGGSVTLDETGVIFLGHLPFGTIPFCLRFSCM